MTAGGKIRIIGGRWRGTRLAVADLPGLRPTSDRVRETVFNWMQPVLPDARVLDLFAGSGALGLEAVSRGAREAVLVERDPGLAEALRAQVERLEATSRVQVILADAPNWLQAPLFGQFDIVFVDPPFESRLWPRVFAALAPWVATDAWMYVEVPNLEAPNVQAPIADEFGPSAGWLRHREGSTRDVRYAIYRRTQA